MCGNKTSYKKIWPKWIFQLDKNLIEAEELFTKWLIEVNLNILEREAPKYWSEVCESKVSYNLALQKLLWEAFESMSTIKKTHVNFWIWRKLKKSLKQSHFILIFTYHISFWYF